MFILGIAFFILIEEFLKTCSVIIDVTGLLCRYTLSSPITGEPIVINTTSRLDLVDFDLSQIHRLELL